MTAFPILQMKRAHVAPAYIYSEKTALHKEHVGTFISKRKAVMGYSFFLNLGAFDSQRSHEAKWKKTERYWSGTLHWG